MKKNFLQKYLPLLAVILTLLYFGAQMRPQSSASGDFDFRRFGMIPVIAEGRHKPLDSVARSNLLVITHRQAYYDYDKPVSVFGVIPSYQRYPATKWLLDVQTTPPPSDNMSPLEDLFEHGTETRPAWKQKVFRIENDQLLAFLGLERRDGLRYSFIEIATTSRQRFNAFLREDQRVRRLEPKHYTLFDAKVRELVDHMQMVVRLSAHSAPLVIPAADGSDKWSTFRDSLEEYSSNDTLPDTADAKAFGYYRSLLYYYDQNDPREFNNTLTKYLDFLQESGKMEHMRLEVFFNEFSPFYHCLVVYVIIAVMGLLSWLNTDWSAPLRRSAFAMMGTVFAFHLSGLVFRMILQNRLMVFVTNLYSSAVFIGLGCIVMCLIAEYFYRNGIAIVVGSVTGACTLYIAHMLSLSGDTMEMMQAVLDTNFWLATHVTCITLGYTSAFVAGFMGLAYILLGIFTNKLRKEGSANLTRMTYGVLCAGMFLSFVGTVLGGLWADYSWGRFWGWDPKENGALLIVIWIALILHARWGGMVKHRGIAVLSVMGIIITSWSWFGTNFLGVGLHSYGFRQGAMTMLILFDLGFLSIAGLGAFLPLHLWQSFCPPAHKDVAPAHPGSTATPKMAGA